MNKKCNIKQATQIDNMYKLNEKETIFSGGEKKKN